MSDGQAALHCIDGWHTDNAEQFRFFTREVNGHTYAKQFLADVRGRWTWALWLVGLIPLGLAILSKRPWVIVLGGAFALSVLRVYLHMLRRVVRAYQQAVLVEGVVQRFDGRHPLKRSFLTGRLVLTRGVVIEPMTVALSEALVKAHARADGSMEVLVSHSPGAEVDEVVGFKLA